MHVAWDRTPQTPSCQSPLARPGSEYKIDASYLSPNVNLASRLEAATKQYSVPMLLSRDFVDCLSPGVRAKVCRRSGSGVFALTKQPRGAPGFGRIHFEARGLSQESCLVPSSVYHSTVQPRTHPAAKGQSASGET